jgi:hypothetical protein
VDQLGELGLCLSNMSHTQVMTTRRKMATITIDNVDEGHYGLAGTESLAQGIPSIAWNHPITLQDQLEHMAPGVGSPFMEVNSLRNAVHTAKLNDELLLENRHAARNWIERFYNSKYLVERYWEPFCDELVKK